MAAQKFHAFVFTVRGTGKLPIDMCRYDRCVPYSQDDVSKSITPVTVEHDIHLIAFSPVGNRLEPTEGRWRSFGWTVVADSVKTVRA
jgi:hypothetical protein